MPIDVYMYITHYWQTLQKKKTRYSVRVEYSAYTLPYDKMSFIAQSREYTYLHAVLSYIRLRILSENNWSLN